MSDKTSTTVKDSPPQAAPPPPAKSGPPRPPAKKSRRGGWLVALLFICVLGAIVYLIFRARNESAAENKATVLAVVKADREDLIDDLWLSAEFKPFLEVAVHAKVAGYLKSISVDVGDHVKADQRIAELEIPELSDDMAGAASAYSASLEDVKRAEAEAEQAKLVNDRLLGVSKEHPKLVAQQDLDNAKARFDAMNGALGAARLRVQERQAEVNRTKTLWGYTFITAPFDGIITQRLVHPGALIQAGTASNTAAVPLVELAEQDLLRLVFPVPESATPIIRNDLPVDVSVTALNETFKAKISRFAGKVDRDTRTMHTEVDVPNPKSRYTPGMYAFVRLILSEQKNALAVPIQALVNGDKPTVFVLNTQGILEERPVTIGLKTPNRVEIRKGLEPGELVVVGNRGGAQAGQKAVGKITVPPTSN